MANCHFLGDDASIERSTPGLLSSARLGVRNVFLNRRTHARSAANCYTLGRQKNNKRFCQGNSSYTL